MPPSAAYARIKSDIYTIACAIPAGRVTTFAAIGAFLDVVPRQVAYLLALRNDAERESTPWYRVVSDGGVLGKPKYDALERTQSELLAAEGITVLSGKVIDDFARCFFAPTVKNTGVVPTRRGDPAAMTNRARS
jgi:methylated-DNA-protein-cysteine methyltransferase related protein